MADHVSLRLRHLRLRAETRLGRFGADIPLLDGLMVLRADNSRGKSTSVQSFLFALGLERMITARPINAVTSAMRDRLIYDSATQDETPVLASWVSLEIEGTSGEVATLTRWVKHDEIDTGLIRVSFGPALSSPEDQYNTEDFYVGRRGAVANPRGFHRWLASFMGWEMPQLPAANGRFAPLYMEQVFPLLFVEQRRGWGGIQASMPYFSGVSDVRRRATEFLLDLEVGRHEGERQRLRHRQDELGDAWRSAVTLFKDGLVGQGLVTVRLPGSLTVAWPPLQPAVVAESRGTGWIPLDDLLAELRAEHARLEDEDIPRIQAVADDMESRLAEALERADQIRQRGHLLREELLRDREEVSLVGSRLEALREDLREHQDIVTLRRLGSAELERLHGDCPVCHQQLPTSLLGLDSPVRTLSPEDSVAYIKQQVELFEVMERDAERALAAKRERLSALQAEGAAVRSDVRALRSALASPDGTPSAEAIARRIRLSDRIERLTAIAERFMALLGTLDGLAQDAREVRANLAELPADRLSADDEEKLRQLQDSFIAQLHDYDFGSFSDERLSISPDDYRPRREEFDLQADISASDSIRVVWAYLLGLLEVSATSATNHPGLLVFDEPRQQSTKTVSFEALLQRAGRDADGRQIIFATSEDLEPLRAMLSGVPHHLHAIDGYVLQRVPE